MLNKTIKLPKMNVHSLIVGGTRGIGRELVHNFSKNGHTVSVIGRKVSTKSDLCLKNVNYFLIDLSDHDQLLSTLKEIIKKNGKLKNLVFFQRYRGNEDDWRGEIEVSLTSTRKIIESLINYFDRKGDNSIVIVSSIASHFIAEEQPLSYHVAKAGLVQMARYYAAILGEKGIRVNCVSPATVIKEESKEFYSKNKELCNIYRKITPLGRLGNSDDVSKVIDFLCSEKASFITGQNLIVDGGASLRWHESLARQITSLGHLNITSKIIGKSGL